jgi:hypothetical protein
MESLQVKDQGPNGWIGVDLDGTLAYYDGWTKWNVFGNPIPRMAERVKRWLKEGKRVKIMTARVAGSNNGRFSREQCLTSGEMFSTEDMRTAIQEWTRKHFGVALEVTCVKDIHMIELWDDRAIQVIPNTGMTLSEERDSVKTAEAGKVFEGAE